MTKIVFMGTPKFAVSIVEALIENYDVVGIVSQPDKKVGRHQTLENTPVKEVALKHNIKLFQPIKIKEDYKDILDLKPDIIITCAYGQMIPKEILDYPELGCINVHASLLPKLRGGAPIHKSIIDNYGKTGITVMYMDQKMDSGDIISQQETIITEDDNLETLSDRLSNIGTKLLLDTLPSIINKTNKRIHQDINEVTYAYNISREEEHLDFTKTSKEIYDRVRGLYPHPGTYILLDNKEFKVYKVRINNINIENKVSGTITNIYKDGLGIKTQDGEVVLLDIKPFGKKRMLTKDYLNGIKKDELIGKVLK